MPIYADGSRAGLPRVLPRSEVPSWFGPRCTTSEFTSIIVPRIGKFYCHKRVAQGFLNVFEDIEKAGKLGLIDISDYGGTYNCRQVRSGSAPSPHSWAIAVDLNVHAHATSSGKETKLAASNYKCDPNRIAPSLRELAPFFYRHGFSWGGLWTGTCDPMHFEATEITVALLEGKSVPQAYTEKMKEYKKTTLDYETGAFLNGKRVGEFKNIDDVGYVPVRTIAEACGLIVDWKTGRVDLTSK
jgi:hypothetical protein